MPGGLEAVKTPSNVISIDTDTNCILCGKAGAVNNAFCFECAANGIQTKVPQPQEFFDEQGREFDFLLAPDIARIGRKLIEHYDDDFHSLYEAEIDYFWKRKGGSSGGRAVLGKCVKVTGALKYYSNKNLLIWLAADNCVSFDYFKLTALTFHELKHGWFEHIEAKTELVGHDFEGFTREIEIFGAWKNDVWAMQKAFEKAAVQPKLF